MEGCRRDKDKVILAANRELSLIQSLSILNHIRRCGECRRVFDEYRRISRLLRHLPEFTLSENAVKRIEARSGIRTKEPSFLVDFLSIIFFSRIKFAGALSVIIIGLFAVLLFRPEMRNSKTNNSMPQFSSSDVSLANQQAREALEILGKFINKTKTQIEYDILSQKVSKPLNKGINTVTDIFKVGDKNESN